MRNEELKKKYANLFKKLGAKFSDENLNELSNYDYHLNDPELLAKFEPTMKIDERGRVHEILDLKKTYKDEIIKSNNLVIMGSTSQYNSYSNITLKDFYTTTSDREVLLKNAKKLIENIKNNNAKQGLYIYGKNRVGKTFIASAIANEVVCEKKVVFVFLPDFIRQTLDFAHNNIEANIKLLKEADLLILDDLGAGIKSPWFRDAVLLPVISERLNLRKVMIVTSNFSYTNLISELANDKLDNATLADKDAATRIISRLIELCKPYKLEDNKGE